MTNSEARLEAIRKAWGKYWDEVKDSVIGMNTGGGWADNETIHYNEDLGCDSKNFEFCRCLYRPKSLSGIEDNHGWTRIEPDGSNLPDKSGDYRFFDMKTYFFKPVVVWFKGNFDRGCNLSFARNYTHFKPIEEDKPPIY